MVKIQSEARIKIACSQCSVRGYFCRSASAIFLNRSIKNNENARKVDGAHGDSAFVELTFRNEMVASIESLSSVHLSVSHKAIELVDKIDALFLSVAELQERPSQDMVKKRRNLFSSAVQSTGKQKRKEEER